MSSEGRLLSTEFRAISLIGMIISQTPPLLEGSCRGIGLVAGDEDPVWKQVLIGDTYVGWFRACAIRLGQRRAPLDGS
jgi:hypothetical protein